MFCCVFLSYQLLQMIAQTHEELVKKIEDVKQTAVAQIQQPVVS
jgi:hypothetical protein